MIQQQPLSFSIIIPAYNYANTLEQAINSVLSQLHDNDELIVINDGSLDNTDQVIAGLKLDDICNAHYLKQENRGLAATRNRGVDESKGDYLIFLDADDELADQGLTSLREKLSELKDTAMLIGAHLSVSPDGSERFRSRPNLPADRIQCLQMYLLDDTLPISNGATAMRRNIFSGYRYPEHFRCVEDIPMFAYVLANFDCSTCNQPIARIHKHADSMRNNSTLNQSVGLDLVEETFHPKRLSEDLQHLKTAFLAKRHLELFRTLYLSGNESEALCFYRQALKLDLRQSLKSTYLRKAIKSKLHAIFNTCK